MKVLKTHLRKEGLKSWTLCGRSSSTQVIASSSAVVTCKLCLQRWNSTHPDEPIKQP